MPDVPLISHEFSNPLFVKIFCRTYERKKTVRGDIGSTTSFEDYVKKQSKQVKRSAGLSNDTHLWRIIIKPFAEWMGQNATGRILSKKAHEIIEAALPGKSVVVLQEMKRHWSLYQSTPLQMKVRLAVTNIDSRIRDSATISLLGTYSITI